MISLLPRSRGVGAQGARVSSIALLLFFVLPLFASTSADATRPAPETHSLVELNAGQVNSEVKFLSPADGLSVPDVLAAKVGGDRNLTGGRG